MTNTGADIKHPKLRGEWAELCFMARAAEHGLIVTKPWGESSHYDFVVESEAHRFLRIQVKSTISRRRKSYGCTLHGTRTFYTNDDFDFLAAYIIPADLWYIIPAGVAITSQQRQKLYLSPDYPKSIYEPYREAWHLLQEKRGDASAAPEPAAEGNDDQEDPEADDAPPIKWKPTWRPIWKSRV